MSKAARSHRRRQDHVGIGEGICSGRNEEPQVLGVGLKIQNCLHRQGRRNFPGLVLGVPLCLRTQLLDVGVEVFAKCSQVYLQSVERLGDKRRAPKATVRFIALFGSALRFILVQKSLHFARPELRLQMRTLMTSASQLNLHDQGELRAELRIPRMTFSPVKRSRALDLSSPPCTRRRPSRPWVTCLGPC